MNLRRLIVALLLIVGAMGIAASAEAQGCHERGLLLTCGGFPPPSFNPNLQVGSLDPALSFSRPSADSCWNSSAVLFQQSSGVACLDYDPVTKVARGFIPQEQRTNLLLWSQDQSNAVWSGFNGGTVTANNVASPDGATHGSTFNFTTTVTSQILQGVTLSSSTAYTLSAWLKVASGTGKAQLKIWDNQTNSYSGDLALTAVWQRFTWTATTGSGSTAGANIAVVNGTDNASRSVQVFGFQLERASFATSYIPTATATATRSADVDSTPLAIGSAVSAVVNGTTAPGAAGTQVLWQADDGTANNRITIQRNASRQIQLVVVSGGVAQATVTASGTVADLTPFKVAFRVQSGDYALILNGGTVATGSGAMPLGLTTHRIGMDTGSSNNWNGWVSQDKVWLRNVPNNRLQTSANDNSAGEAAA